MLTLFCNFALIVSQEEDDAVIVGGFSTPIVSSNSPPLTQQQVSKSQNRLSKSPSTEKITTYTCMCPAPKTHTLFCYEINGANSYYPRSAGGGCKHLFRKVGDESSSFHPEQSRVRRDGSYIYEQFMNTEGTDVKVYASAYPKLSPISCFKCSHSCRYGVGADYAHAEARKSPVVDGKARKKIIIFITPSPSVIL